MAMAPSAASACSAVSFPARPAAASSARPRASAAGTVKGGSSGKWWAPLLGWSGQPDYIDAHPASSEEEPLPRGPPSSARRFGVLTEDKARRLRMQMMEAESFHDAMYHSAIASRLASAAPDNKR